MSSCHSLHPTPAPTYATLSAPPIHCTTKLVFGDPASGGALRVPSTAFAFLVKALTQRCESNLLGHCNDTKNLFQIRKQFFRG